MKSSRCRASVVARILVECDNTRKHHGLTLLDNVLTAIVMDVQAETIKNCFPCLLFGLHKNVVTSARFIHLAFTYSKLLIDIRWWVHLVISIACGLHNTHVYVHSGRLAHTCACVCM